jgi:hypothetical protein
MRLGLRLFMERIYEFKTAAIAENKLMLNFLNNNWAARKTKIAMITAERAKKSLKPKILKNINQGVNIIAPPRRWSFGLIPSALIFTRFSGNFPGRA